MPAVGDALNVAHEVLAERVLVAPVREGREQVVRAARVLPVAVVVRLHELALQERLDHYVPMAFDLHSTHI